MGGGGLREGWLGGGRSKWGDLGWGGGGGAQAPLTSPCPPSNHSITINLTLTFAAIDWAEQDPPISFMAAFATSLLSILDPNTHSEPRVRARARVRVRVRCRDRSRLRVGGGC